MNGEQIIWVMEQDCCEMCNGLLDYFGQCPQCGWESAYGYDWDDSSEEDDYYADCYEDDDEISRLGQT